MRAVVITNDVVTNVVEVDDGWSPQDTRWQPPEGSVAVVSDTAEVGDTYSQGVFTKPPPVIPPVTIPQVISDRQFYQQLAVVGLITEIEALAAVKTGDIPPALQELVDALPPEQQFAATMLLAGATTFIRDHPLTIAFGFAFGWMPSQLDDLWIEASKL